MSNVLGVNAVFHDSAAALVVDGRIVAVAEEERFSRRKHGKEPVPFSTWELPRQAMRWCLADAGLAPGDLDVVAYSYGPQLATRPGDVGDDMTADEWEGLRTLFVRWAARFLTTALPGLAPERVTHVLHHVAHAASACIAAPHETSSVLVLDGRGERASHLAGRWADDKLDVLAIQDLPHSLGLLYEEVTAHLGFRRSSDEDKVRRWRRTATRRGSVRCSGTPFRDAVHTTQERGFVADRVDLSALVPARTPGTPWSVGHADLAAALQRSTEEVVLDLARWLHRGTGDRALTMAGGVALNCVANGRLAAEGPFDQVWVRPAAGDAGTALGAALYESNQLGERCPPMPGAALGRHFTPAQVEGLLREAEQPNEQPADLAEVVAAALAEGAVVGWFEGRSEFGPRALGHRSLLCDPRRADNLQRMNTIKGREEFRPVAPMVLADRAPAIFEGQLPSPTCC